MMAPRKYAAIRCLQARCPEFVTEQCLTETHTYQHGENPERSRVFDHVYLAGEDFERAVNDWLDSIHMWATLPGGSG